ncbi:calcyclin-binding protein-like [Oscarella lobularis]|uniref:calcyclin-binding protein-like n=1 Tax=Oscarella lobularis TaxID=121494 RepID=UPI003313E229
MALAKLRLDSAELSELLGKADRERTKGCLLRELNVIQKEIQALEEAERHKPASGTEATNAQRANPKAYVKKITTYGWDQTDRSVKIYVDLSGVEKLPPENVQVVFDKKSVCLDVLGLAGKNHQLHILNLLETISPDKSSYKVKSGSVYITLVKVKEAKWDSLVPQKKKETPKFDKDGDPNKGIMDMMKNMYQDGDDEMKRIIAKAWTESQEKQAGKGLDD